MEDIDEQTCRNPSRPLSSAAEHELHVLLVQWLEHNPLALIWSQLAHFGVAGDE